MKTKVVYVLVSSDNDLYYEQTLISAFSCRKHNPDACIVLVMDEYTAKTLTGKRSLIRKYVSDVIVAKTPPDFNGMQKSRYIKTNLRTIVEGDFLYIDSDTIIASDLSEIDSVKCDLAAVYDSNREQMISDTTYISDCYINHNTNAVGWPSVIGHPNYNGGVLLVRESKIAYDFYKRWFQLWLECKNKGMNIDMVALCRSNIELGHCIYPLPGIWNCQIQRQGLSLLSKAKIIHCFTGGNISGYRLCKKEVLEKVKRKGRLDLKIRLEINFARYAFDSSAWIRRWKHAIADLYRNSFLSK